MDWHAVVEAAARVHGLSEAQRRDLLAMGGAGTARARWAANLQHLPLALLGLAGLLAGLGLIFAIAANWAAWPRAAQFGLLQAAVAVGAAGVFLQPKLRMPLGLWCLLSTGGLLAFFGQTYQTGADAWQLFALWAALCLPLALGVRADTVWSAWVLVVLTAISLGVTAHTRHGALVDGDGLRVHLMGWGLALALVLGLNSPPGRRFGAGAWARRAAACFAVVMVTTTAVMALFGGDPAAEVLLALAVLGAMAWLAARRATFELFVLSAAALGLNTLLVGSLVRLLFAGPVHGNPIGQLLLIGLAAAGLLAGTVSGVLRLSRAAAAQVGGAA